MNLQQLEYIIAIDKYRHFVTAAENCHITQPTLTMMVQKLEDEIGLKIFDRTKKPIEPTAHGKEIIERAKKVLNETNWIKTYAKELKGEISGTLKLAIIPTLAPYLLPLFLKNFLLNNPKITVYVKELFTDDIKEKLKLGDIDVGIMATPLEDNLLQEHAIFEEEFLVYASKNENIFNKKYIVKEELNLNHLWLLEEGHCLRNQVFNLCELRKKETDLSNLHYEAGSIETLINLVDRQNGFTIIPKLATSNLNVTQQQNLKEFADPIPTRQISLVVLNNFPRIQLIEQLKVEIMKILPKEISQNSKKKFSLPISLQEY